MGIVNRFQGNVWTPHKRLDVIIFCKMYCPFASLLMQCQCSWLVGTVLASSDIPCVLDFGAASSARL